MAGPSAVNLWLARALLGASAVMHFYLGAAFAIDAAPWIAGLAIAPTDPAGLIEMRAFYGGLMLAFGVLFALALQREWLFPGMVMMTVTYLGAASVRTAWIVIDGVTDPWLVQILAVEAFGALAGAASLFAGGLRPRA